MRNVLYFDVLFRNADMAQLAADRAAVVQADGDDLRTHFFFVALAHDALRVPSIKSIHFPSSLEYVFFKNAGFLSSLFSAYLRI